MTLSQVPMIKVWGQDTSNKSTFTQDQIGTGIVLGANIVSNQLNGISYSTWLAIQFLQQTGGMYSALIPYLSPDIVSLLEYNGGSYALNSYVRLTSNPGSTTNNTPLTGASISTVNGIDIYTGGTINTDWQKVTTAGSGGIGLPAIETMADLQKISKEVSSNSLQNAFVNGFIEMGNNTYEVGANGQINTSNNYFEFSGVTGTSTYIIDRAFLSKTINGGELQASVNINNLDIYDVSAGVSTTQTQLKATMDTHLNLPSGISGWFVKMICTDLGSGNFTKFRQADNGQYITLTSGTTYGSSLLSLTHSAIASTLPAATTTVKYIFIFDNSALSYSITSPTASESFNVLPASKIVVNSYNGQSLIFSDNFNRANGVPANNWTVFSDTGPDAMQIYSNQLNLTGVYGEVRTNNSRCSRNAENYSNLNQATEITANLSFYKAGNTNNTDVAVTFDLYSAGTSTWSNAIQFDGYTNQIYFYKNGVQVSSTAYTIIPSNGPIFSYSVRVRWISGTVYVKIWQLNTVEPSSWTWTYSVTGGFYAGGAYMQIGMSVFSNGANNSTTTLDDLFINKITTGAAVYYDKTNLSGNIGDKIALKIFNTRGLATNTDKQIIKYAGLLQ